MASSWVSERVDRIKAAEQKEIDRRGWTLVCDGVLVRGGAGLLGRLASVVEADVDQFNLSFAADRRKKLDFQAVPSHRFIVRRASYHSFHLECWWDAEERSIRFTARSRRSYDSGSIDSAGRFKIVVREGNGLQLQSEGNDITYEDASQLLMGPFLW